MNWKYFLTITLCLLAVGVIFIFSNHSEVKKGCAGGVNYIEINKTPDESIQLYIKQNSNYSEFQVSNPTLVAKNCHNDTYLYDISKNGTEIGQLRSGKLGINDTEEVIDMNIQISREDYSK